MISWKKIVALVLQVPPGPDLELGTDSSEDEHEEQGTTLRGRSKGSDNTQNLETKRQTPEL